MPWIWFSWRSIGPLLPSAHALLIHVGVRAMLLPWTAIIIVTWVQLGAVICFQFGGYEMETGMVLS